RSFPTLRANSFACVVCARSMLWLLMLTRSILIYSLSFEASRPYPVLIGRGSSKLYFKMHMRPCCSSGRSNLGYGVAAGHPVSCLDKILIVVSVQHLTAIFRLYKD